MRPESGRPVLTTSFVVRVDKQAIQSSRPKQNGRSIAPAAYHPTTSVRTPAPLSHLHGRALAGCCSAGRSGRRAAALHNRARATADQPLHPAATLRTSRNLRLRHLLPLLKMLSASPTQILVSRHPNLSAQQWIDRSSIAVYRFSVPHPLFAEKRPHPLSFRRSLQAKHQRAPRRVT